MGAKKKHGRGPFDALRALRDELKSKTPEAGSAKTQPPPKRAAVDAPADEALLLHRMFAGVEPLDKAPGRIPKQAIAPSPSIHRLATDGRDAAEADANAVHEHLRTLVEAPARFEVADDGARVEGRRVDLPMDALRRLRRGHLPIDARLDLHGMRIDEARTQLDAFLRTTRARGERCVLVIHGKGEHSPGGVGVLRGEMSAWLAQGPSSEHVAAFATASAHDGGDGAVYVLLRR